MNAPRGRKQGPPPEHRPKKYLKHVADEYEDLGNVQVAAELRRHLRGHYERWRAVAGGSFARDATSGNGSAASDAGGHAG